MNAHLLVGAKLSHDNDDILDLSSGDDNNNSDLISQDFELTQCYMLGITWSPLWERGC